MEKRSGQIARSGSKICGFGGSVAKSGFGGERATGSSANNLTSKLFCFQKIESWRGRFEQGGGGHGWKQGGYNLGGPGANRGRLSGRGDGHGEGRGSTLHGLGTFNPGQSRPDQGNSAQSQCFNTTTHTHGAQLVQNQGNASPLRAHLLRELEGLTRAHIFHKALKVIRALIRCRGLFIGTRCVTRINKGRRWCVV